MSHALSRFLVVHSRRASSVLVVVSWSEVEVFFFSCVDKPCKSLSCVSFSPSLSFLHNFPFEEPGLFDSQHFPKS